MRKTLLKLFTFVLCITGIQNALLAQEQTPLNQVVNTLKERISLSGYAQLDILMTMQRTRTIHSTSNESFSWHTERSQTVDL